MLNIFKSDKSEDVVEEQAVILEIPFESGNEFGSKEDHEALEKLENNLSAVILCGEELDGHEFGEGTATLYLYGPSADKLLERIRGILRASAFNRFEVTLRYGTADNPNAKEKHFTLSW